MSKSNVQQHVRIAFGPELPDWGSWQWVGADLAQALGERASTFKAWEEPDAEVVVVIKHQPPREWIERVGRQSAVLYCPIDVYGSPEEIAADAAMLRLCRRIVVHCRRLEPYFAPYAPTSYLDHHLKFAAPLRRKYRPEGRILWVGVRSNLQPLVEWVNAHPLPAALDVLTNLESPQSSPEAGDLGFRSDMPIAIHRWSPELQQQLTATARAAIDIKADDFRGRHKPPAKAIDFIASGVPLAMNPDSSSAEHLAGLGFSIASPLDAQRWLSKDYWRQTRRLGRKLRSQLNRANIAQRLVHIAHQALKEPSRTSVLIASDGRREKTGPDCPELVVHSGDKSNSHPNVVDDDPNPQLQLYGLLITKDDGEAFADWCRDQLPLYDAVVCLDGSGSDATERLAAQFPDRLIYLHERDFRIRHKTDHGLRRLAHQEIVSRFGAGHWIMCCHVDEYCYHDPRLIARRAEREGYDSVSWYSPHFYPHPAEMADWNERRLRPVSERFAYYHWSYHDDGLPWIEDRLYRAKAGVDWDDSTHGTVRPHGLERPAPYHPIFRHFKVLITDPAWYEREPNCAHYRHHWQGLEHRTGLPYPVREFKDLFVRAVPQYSRCDRFDGYFDQSWNIGEQFRPTGLALMAADRRQHGRAGDLAVAGQWDDARLLLEPLDRDDASGPCRGLIRNDLAVLAALRGELESARQGFQAALAVDPECVPAEQNLATLQEPALAIRLHAQGEQVAAPKKPPVKVAVVSFLFNWPSTGGGNVHTAELTRFLAEAGYDVRHIHARFEPWGIGAITEPTPFPSDAVRFTDSDWNAPTIQRRFRQAVEAFGPDYVILTDSWNFKPLLAEAVRGYPYLLRLQALECLCPLNNVRLLPEPGGRVRQCALHQLATPEDCLKCLRHRGRQSGALHQAERELSGVGTPEYTKLLRQAFAEAECVLVVNPLTEAMISPFSRQVRVVTAGMDPARFPWPAPPRPDNSKKVILFAGLTQEWMKGFHVLRAACDILWAKRQDFELVATADADGDSAPFLRFVGWQSQADLAQRLYECDVLAMPTVAQEALGRTAVEAMAAGKPVVASRLGGLPFTVIDGATGLLAEPGDPADLARKLETLLDDSELRKRLGNAGRRRFEEHYSWPVIIERHYRPLLTPRSASSG